MEDPKEASKSFLESFFIIILNFLLKTDEMEDIRKKVIEIEKTKEEKQNGTD